MWMVEPFTLDGGVGRHNVLRGVAVLSPISTRRESGVRRSISAITSARTKLSEAWT